jgi:hypothetical protein
MQDVSLQKSRNWLAGVLSVLIVRPQCLLNKDSLQAQRILEDRGPEAESSELDSRQLRMTKTTDLAKLFVVLCAVA